MKLFHASPYIVKSPDVEHSRSALDFGKGFYLTPIRQQAEDYANRFLRENKMAYLNSYVLVESFKTKFKIKIFYEYNDEWLDFILSCRLMQPVEEYDCIFGGIANDRIFNTINLYTDGLISKKEALDRLIFYKPNMQICIRNQELIDNYLSFIEYKEIR